LRSEYFGIAIQSLSQKIVKPHARIPFCEGAGGQKQRNGDGGWIRLHS
jgi:hypothetical protein